MMKEKKEKTIKEKYEEFAKQFREFALDGLALGTAYRYYARDCIKKCHRFSCK